jgi:hypothetical protein
MNNQKGQILLVVFMLLLFTGIIVGGIAFLWQSGVNTAALEKDSLRAFYLAQAGIERGRAEIAYESLTNTNMDSYAPSFLNNSAFGGSYDVAISTVTVDQKQILATGRFGNSTRKIKMTINKNSTGGGSPPYGNAWGYWANHQDAWIEQ